MNLTRRDLAAAGVFALAATTLIVPAVAATDDEDAVKQAVESLRKAILAQDKATLETLAAEQLSYSHSDGNVEDKATFIANATNGKSKFTSLKYEDTKIRIVGPVAIVRFHWLGEQESTADGKKSSTNLHILMNWVKQGSDWKLLTRASTKLG